MKNSWFAPLWRHKILFTAMVSSLLAGVYWLFIASDRYVSSAHVIVQRTDLPAGPALDLGTLVAGVGTASASRPDLLLLREHLLSVDMLRKLDAQLNLRQHFASPQADLLSRMWRGQNSIEWFHRHYHSRVSVELDDYSGVLVIQAQAYDAATAQAIASFLVREGEAFMNRLAHQLAQAQVTFLEGQVQQLSQRALQTRQAVIEFQNSKGLVSPQASAQNLSAIVATLEAQRAELQTQRASLQAYLVPDHPSIQLLNQQITAVERQLATEQAKLAAPQGSTLNRTVEEFQRLEQEAAFAQQLYQSALTALEKGRIEATRLIKKVQVLQAPTLAEYPLQPRRYYNTLVFVLTALLLAGVAHLVMAIVRDHQD